MEIDTIIQSVIKCCKNDDYEDAKILFKDDLIKDNIHVFVPLICRHGSFRLIKLFLDYYPFINIGGIGTGYMRFRLYHTESYEDVYNKSKYYSLFLIILAIVIVVFAIIF